MAAVAVCCALATGADAYAVGGTGGHSEEVGLQVGWRLNGRTS